MRKIIPVVAAGATALAVAGTTFAYAALNNDVTLAVDGQTSEVTTMNRTVGDVLAGQGITLGAHDVVAPSLDASRGRRHQDRRAVRPPGDRDGRRAAEDLLDDRDQRRPGAAEPAARHRRRRPVHQPQRRHRSRGPEPDREHRQDHHDRGRGQGQEDRDHRAHRRPGADRGRDRRRLRRQGEHQGVDQAEGRSGVLGHQGRRQDGDEDHEGRLRHRLQEHRLARQGQDRRSRPRARTASAPSSTPWSGTTARP